MRLDPAAELAGYRVMAHEVLDSTNAEALRVVRGCSGTTNPLWITAQQQTAGRGRRGNVWISPSGNLYATLLLSDPAPPKNTPQLAFVAGLAVHDAIGECAAALREHLALKWPNDVLCSGKKISGILIEGHSLGSTLAVAIGVGVNCKHHPAKTSYPATDLAEAGGQVSVGDLFFALSGSMVRRLAQWRRGDAFAGTRADWLARSRGIGGDMRVRLPGGELFGRCERLDEAGRLVLRLADGSRQTIAAGEVFPLGEAHKPLVLEKKIPPDGAD
jgi:BirA family transcriptional regulator, biotin operon repressor / biotin---[acetyl-CoA-carboxylase] ligase